MTAVNIKPKARNSAQVALCWYLLWRATGRYLLSNIAAITGNQKLTSLELAPNPTA